MITEDDALAEYTQNELKALNTAKEFIAKQYPDYDTSDKVLTLDSTKDTWNIYYTQSSNPMLRSPRVEIDKQKMTIVNAYKSYKPTSTNYTEDEAKALAIGKEIIAEQFPDYETTDKVLAMNSKGDVWVIYYQSLSPSLDGSPVVEIDKKTLDVMKTYKTQ